VTHHAPTCTEHAVFRTLTLVATMTSSSRFHCSLVAAFRAFDIDSDPVSGRVSYEFVRRSDVLPEPAEQQ
jgi:hypothetical protein